MFARSRGPLFALLVILALVPGGVLASEGKFTPRLTDSLATHDKAADSRLTVWVRFTDKGVTDADLPDALARAAAALSTANLERRTKASADGGLVDIADLPLAPAYLDAVAATGAVARRQSRWLNAASWEATPAQLEAIASLPFVDVLDLVGGGNPVRPAMRTEVPEGTSESSGDKALHLLDYGASYDGLEQINVPAAHSRGLSGEGVTVAILDTGFRLEHDAFNELDVVATWDFVNDDPDVGHQEGESIEQLVYGTATLSAVAGFDPSNIVGSAYRSRVILAKTENLDDETQAEEDNWIAAVEWAEGLGADVIVSGLGYYYWYDFSDLDGNTALITVAAEMAAARGICVVNQAGNERATGWGTIIPPADGRSVIAVGAADLNGQVAWYSSPGPTADGRIKPDVLALGSGTVVANPYQDDAYYYAYGSSFAAALLGGGVCLMVEQNPSLNPVQIMTALHETGNRSNAPDNDFGWGLANIAGAIDHWAPVLEHTPLVDTEGGTGPMPVTATVTSRMGLDESRISIAWRVADENWNLVPMTPVGVDVYEGRIPPQSRTGTPVEYYLVATDIAGNTASLPADAPDGAFAFRVGADTTPPTLSHMELADQTEITWPPTVVAEITDNLGLDRVEIQITTTSGWSSGPLDMAPAGDDMFEMEMPVPPVYIRPGVSVRYLIFVFDQADEPNFTLGGPYTLDILETRGRVLIVDDRGNSKEAPAGRTYAAPTGEKSADDLAGALADAGFEVNTINASDVVPGSFFGYDVVMVSSGSNWSPLSYPSLRSTMLNWVEEGGRLVVEGGEVAYAVSEQPGYPDLMGTVLPISGYNGEDGAIMRPATGMKDHPLVNRPHVLATPWIIDNGGGNDYGAADLVLAADEAIVAMQTGYGTRRGGLVVHDDNTGPDSGQIVFMPFNVMLATETDARALLENTMVFLTTVEPPGTAGINGTVLLAGEDDHADVTVRNGMLQSTLTLADGSFDLDGLWGGTYTITAEKEGFAPQTRTVTVVDGEATGGVEFYLLPVTGINAPATPNLPIPDNDPAGVESTVEIVASGKVLGIDVDIDISHFSIGHLVVTLTNPSGTAVTLHNRTGETADDLVGNWPTNLVVDGPGSLDDFLNEDAGGTWTMKVVDAQFGASGTFHSWGLNLLVTASGVSSAKPGIPEATRLTGNVPNPFNPRTTISFEVARQGHVKVDVYDVRGRLVRRLADRTFDGGRHSVVWDGRDESGGQPASGIYFCRLRTGGSDEVRKMMLVR